MRNEESWESYTVRYHAVEPFGEERGDLRAGIVASVLANIHRPPTRAPFSPADFMPYGERAAQREPDRWNFSESSDLWQRKRD